MAQIIRYAREHKLVTALGMLLLVIVVAALVRGFFGGEEAAVEQTGKQVEVASISELSNNRAPLSLVGEVRAQSEASLYAESGGEVRRVTVEAGDTVAAGTILAELENAAQRASLAQAQGSLQAAQANLAKVTVGDRPEDKASAQASQATAAQNVETAKKAALDATKSAFTLAEDAVRNKADITFTNPQSSNVNLKFSLPSIKHGDLESRIEGGRRDVEGVLTNWSQHLTARSPQANPDTELSRARSNLERIQRFLNDLGEGVNSTALQEAEVETWKSQVAQARSALSSALSTVTSAQQSLDAAELSLEQADNTLTVSQQGGRPEDINAARAQVAQAQGGVQASLAALENTIIRTPIGGTVSTLSIKQGDFVAPNTLAAVVTNEGALEIETFITAEDRVYIEEGARVLIDNRVEGVVTNVAPGLNPTTQKISVKIGIVTENAQLTHGDTVRVSIARTVDEEDTQMTDIRIPITALKVGTSETVVFTVEDGKLVSHTVVVGPLLGDTVIISEGVTPEMAIVLDARGLTAGQSVSVAEN